MYKQRLGFVAMQLLPYLKDLQKKKPNCFLLGPVSVLIGPRYCSWMKRILNLVHYELVMPKVCFTITTIGLEL